MVPQPLLVPPPGLTGAPVPCWALRPFIIGLSSHLPLGFCTVVPSAGGTLPCTHPSLFVPKDDSTLRVAASTPASGPPGTPHCLVGE